uniref:Kringle domain-containing protein n=1 Tax=Neogobius melanostomus TaxID=47308 RepID=A0A8C6WGS7_9GOBI
LKVGCVTFLDCTVVSCAIYSSSLASVCRPNPCQNGGSCLKSSKFIKMYFTGPNDCYEDNGDSYRGMVSVTVDGDECLDWNSYFILRKGGDPFTEYAGFDGLGPHNFYSQPWCYFKQNNLLGWKYCNVRQCSTGKHTGSQTHSAVFTAKFE